jgi:hypothetical protein
VFKILAGWEKASVQPPFALTDRGQISKVTALIAEGPRWSWDENRGIIAVAPSSGETWTRAALGGKARVEMLSSLFADLRAKGVQLTIITKGYVGAVRKLLLEEGLLDNFDRVIGFTEKFYGENDYDKLNHEPSKLEGEPDSALQVSKAEFVWAVLQREGLHMSQAVLVEDDPAEIASVQQPQICRDLFVSKRQGMTAAEMDSLRRLATPGGPAPPATPPTGPPKAPMGVTSPPLPPGTAAPPLPPPPSGVTPPPLPPGITSPPPPGAPVPPKATPAPPGAAPPPSAGQQLALKRVLI